MIAPTPNKQLGQHWLYDPATLQSICDDANIGTDDTVLEIGPGLGTLTSELARRAKQVVAVEFDPVLAAQLPGRIHVANVRVVHADILTFDLSQLPQNYKVVANLPYYITSKITRLLLESANSPASLTLLVQKEVARRMAAVPGKMSILAVAVQCFTEPHLGLLVPAALFTPPPKVDSQVITLIRRPVPLYGELDREEFFWVVKAGFAEKRKTLRNSLSGGLQQDKDSIEQLLFAAGIDPGVRAEALSLTQWVRLAELASDWKKRPR